MKNIFPILLLISLIGLGCNGLTEEQVRNNIETSRELTELNNMCEELPKPKSANLIHKTAYSNGVTFTVGNIYETKTGFAQTANFFLDYFKKENWTIKENHPQDELGANGGLTVERNGITISVTQGRAYEFFLDCSQRAN
jgi:hypothetical protein